MSPIPLLALLLPTGAPKDWFADAVAAHRKLNEARIQLDVVQLLGKTTTRARYDIAYVRPHELSLRIKEPAQGGRTASDRTFVLIGDKLFAYDADVHERLSRTVPIEGDVVARLSTAMSARFDDSVACLIDPARLDTFLKPFRGQKGWQTSISRGLATVTRATGTGAKKGRSTLRFDSVTGLLRGVRLDIPGGRLEWTVAYSTPPKAITYRPPQDAAPVASFTERRPMATFLDAKAKAVAERAIRAYDRLRHVSFRVEGAVAIKAWISAGKVREDGADVRYSWDGQRATILDLRRKVAYSGKAGRTALIDALGALGARMDPTVRQIVTRQNPVRMLLVPGMRVKSSGQVTLQGVRIDLIEFQNPSGRVVMGLRSDNGLLDSVRTTLHDRTGTKISDAKKSFVYSSVGKPVDQASLALTTPGGFKKAALESLLK